MRRPTVIPWLLVPLLLTGCAGNGQEDDAVPGTSSSAPSSTTSPSVSPSGGCPATDDTAPADASTAPTVDVDGDGAPDTAWNARGSTGDGGVPFGVTTASGATAGALISSASPVERSVLFADVTGDGEVVALASDGRQVLLYTVADCAITPVRDDRGRPFAFDLGLAGTGTGVACEDADDDGTRDLLGLLLQPSTDATSEPVVQQTVVELDGAVAHLGAAFAAPAGDEVRQQMAGSVTCGDLDLEADGVTAGR
ncbi:hypothetical protein [Modestobacter marinus]|uniref:hypothetical protein n=1 Tax=Modestobacter marinus TaxID=477641 RepID=UPI001C9817A6|nr:hypothetical protein [Modestobacter marinus]